MDNKRIIVVGASRGLGRGIAAALAKDVHAFIGLYAQDVRVFDTWGVWSHEGAAAWRQVVQQWFASLGHESVAVSMEDVKVAGGHDLAMVSAIVTYVRGRRETPLHAEPPYLGADPRWGLLEDRS